MNLVKPQLLKLAALLVTAALVMQPAGAGELVVVTASNNLEQLNQEDVARIFLGKLTTYPGGGEVEPLTPDPGDPVFAEFAQKVLNKTPAQLKAYWAKRIFTGKGKPPRSLADRAELLRLVGSDKKYLSFMYREDTDDAVRQVILLDD